MHNTSDNLGNILATAKNKLDIHFIRSSGHGGQNVNKRSTCCQIIDHFDYSPYLSQDQRKHFASPIVIKSGNQRHQHLNKEEALHIWSNKVHELFKKHFDDTDNHPQLTKEDTKHLGESKRETQREREYRSIFRHVALPHDSAIKNTSDERR